jgi:glycosyltransferase involved in cell wall biosynthesis
MAPPQKPFVSVVTPTYNRRPFMKALIQCYRHQTYPKDRMEWIIFDDGTDPVEDCFKEWAKDLPNIRYIRETEKQVIGVKRNRLNKEARGEIIVAMDDDDYYPPERVSHVVESFAKQPRVELAGSTEIYMYYTDIDKIYRIGPYGPQHATNGTMAWRSSYSKRFFYNEAVTHAEEKSFLDDYKHPMIQLSAHKTMLVMSHSMNTFDKKMFREGNPMCVLTSMKLKDWVKNKDLRDFYSKA